MIERTVGDLAALPVQQRGEVVVRDGLHFGAVVLLAEEVEEVLQVLHSQAADPGELLRVNLVGQQPMELAEVEVTVAVDVQAFEEELQLVALRAFTCASLSSLVSSSCSAVTFAMLSETTAVNMEKIAQLVSTMKAIMTYLDAGTVRNKGSRASRSAFMALKRLKKAMGMSSKVSVTSATSASPRPLGITQPRPT
eukprot:CAMPEP_0171241256 /NCGR_PEP_ID=MMETSP0790-20130122/44986_1 /TAXON_ID=2925 /ORGANISM="Alexandrium catenella, Strain OF101" /LENGTH=194 /DNA_ID=CAMNT_0011707829 /DNA_START=61 /DNA_END=642 /DNA_ORIENTATION=-